MIGFIGLGNMGSGMAANLAKAGQEVAAFDLSAEALERAAAGFMSLPDEAAIAAMRLLAARGIVSGESGAAGLAGLLALASDAEAREALELTEHSRVLCFSTEGATDRELYDRLVGAD